MPDRRGFGLDDSRHRQRQRGRAVQDDVGKTARRGERAVGMDRIPDARALGVGVSQVGGDRDADLAARGRVCPDRVGLRRRLSRRPVRSLDLDAAVQRPHPGGAHR